MAFLILLVNSQVPQLMLSEIARKQHGHLQSRRLEVFVHKNALGTSTIVILQDVGFSTKCC